MSRPADLYHGAIDIEVLKNSKFAKEDASVRILSIYEKKVRLVPAVKTVFVYSEQHICVVYRREGSRWYVFDSYPTADERLLAFVRKHFERAAECWERPFPVQKDALSCLAYAVAFARLAGTAAAADRHAPNAAAIATAAAAKLSQLPLHVVRELAFRTLGVLE